MTTQKAPPRKRKDVLTKAQWDKIEQQARKAEREPDPSQLSIAVDGLEPSTPTL